MSQVQEPPKIDAEYPDVTVHRLAFGSCHRNKAVKPNQQPIIWDAISLLKPDAFLWTGDTIYTAQKTGVSPIELLQYEYDQMLHNDTLGYKTFLEKAQAEGFLKGGIHATWDDHDYGGNDYGVEMLDRQERQNAFLDFLGVDPKEDENRRQRHGVYYSVTFGKVPRKVKVIFLDTRSSRSQYCIPSVGAMPIPFGLGSVVSCITRWITAGFRLQEYIPKCRDAKVLDEVQWKWLEGQLLDTDAQINLVVSSIQVLTTNPMFETWGQFPQERKRLLGLLNSVEEQKSVVLLSGDVHHGEILDSSVGVKRSMGRTIEVTSSGLTHR
jgi:Phosphodiesterase/alkaline phosphatase D